MKRLIKNHFLEMLQEQNKHCINCTVGSFNNCPENTKKYCPHRNSTRVENLLTCFVMLLATMSAVAKEPQIGYLVTVHDTSIPKIEVHRFDNIAYVDSIVMKTFVRSIPWFEAAEMLKETNFFEIVAENKSLYCEKKRIVGRKKNGELKFRNIKRWRL